MPTYRNPYAAHPLLRKGGVHIRSKTGQRSRDHYRLRDEAAECLEEYFHRDETDSDDLVGDVEGERDAPLSFWKIKFNYSVNVPVSFGKCHETSTVAITTNMPSHSMVVTGSTPTPAIIA